MKNGEVYIDRYEYWDAKVNHDILEDDNSTNLSQFTKREYKIYNKVLTKDIKKVIRDEVTSKAICKVLNSSKLFTLTENMEDSMKKLPGRVKAVKDIVNWVYNTYHGSDSI